MRRRMERRRRNGMIRYAENDHLHTLVVGSSGKCLGQKLRFRQIKSIKGGEGESKSDDMPRVYALHRYTRLENNTWGYALLC